MTVFDGWLLGCATGLLGGWYWFSDAARCALRERDTWRDRSLGISAAVLARKDRQAIDSEQQSNRGNA